MLTYELADLIDKEENAEVAVLLAVNVFLHLCGKGLHRDRYIIVHDFGADNVGGECRVNLLCHLKGKVKTTCCEAGDIAFPVVTLTLDVRLELPELAIVIKSFFQVLSQGEVERVETTPGIELIPENGGEGCLLVGIDIMHITNVEHHHLHICLRHIPVTECFQFRHRYTFLFQFGHAVGMEHDVLSGFYQTDKSHLTTLLVLRETITRVFQKMGFTRTVISVDPDTNMAALVVLDVGKDII